MKIKNQKAYRILNFFIFFVMKKKDVKNYKNEKEAVAAY